MINAGGFRRRLAGRYDYEAIAALLPKKEWVP